MTSRRGTVGVDIGGTKVAVAAVDPSGTICARNIEPTEPNRPFEESMDRLAKAVRDTVARAGWSLDDLSGLGVGCPGPLDLRAGTVHDPFTLPAWDGENLVGALRERLGLRVRLENDADAALLGEAWTGAGRGYRHLAMFTLGTGVGGAVIADGNLYRSHRGEHPELGHIPVGSGGDPCYCGHEGCLEATSSGTAITRKGRAAGFRDAPEVMARARAGDEAAGRIVQAAVAGMVSAVWTLLHTFVPERVILGGGIGAGHFDTFEPPLRGAVDRATMVDGRGISVVRAALGADAGLVGAASLLADATRSN